MNKQMTNALAMLQIGFMDSIASSILFVLGIIIGIGGVLFFGNHFKDWYAAMQEVNNMKQLVSEVRELRKIRIELEKETKMQKQTIELLTAQNEEYKQKLESMNDRITKIENQASEKKDNS